MGMKDRRKRGGLYVVALNRAFPRLLVLVFFFGFSFSTLRLLLRGNSRPRLISLGQTPALKVISGDSQAVSVRETVTFPEQTLIFLKYPQTTPLFTKDDINCVYLSPNSSQPQLNLQPFSIDGEFPDLQIVWCPIQPRGLTASIVIKSNGRLLPIEPTYNWDSLAYEALIDRDNSTIVFAKGLNLRGGRAADPSRFECVYGWDFTKSKLFLQSEVISIGQEVVRCKTPLSILSGPQSMNSSIKGYWECDWSGGCFESADGEEFGAVFG